MARLVHVDGELVPIDRATVSIQDRGFRYGDALFETMRAYGGELFEWDAHWDRLQRGSETIGLDHGLAQGDAAARIQETLAANEFSDAYVRLSVTRGVQGGRLTPAPTTDPTTIIVTEPLPRGGTRGQSIWDAPATCAIVDTAHVSSEALPSHLKSHNYLNGILAKREAAKQDADEALLLDDRGYLTEGTTTNLFFVDHGTLRTPAPTDHPLLPGITRRVVLELAEEQGIPVDVGSCQPGALTEASEVFVTNTTWEVRPVTAVDNHTYSVGGVTQQLISAFDERVELAYIDA